MQCADIFFLNVDVVQMGMDQLKVNMLAREYCDKSSRKKKPIIISHKIIKSSPDTAIFMSDDESDVNRKIKRAYCCEDEVTGPIFELCEHILFPTGHPLIVPNTSGENIVYNDYSTICEDFIEKKLHPADLKTGVAVRINMILDPVRSKFASGEMAQLLKTVCGYKLTK